MVRLSMSGILGLRSRAPHCGRCMLPESSRVHVDALGQRCMSPKPHMFGTGGSQTYNTGSMYQGVMVFPYRYFGVKVKAYFNYGV